jgi:hypothetical protein
MSATVRTVFGISSLAASDNLPPHLTCSPIGWRPVKMEVRLDRRAISPRLRSVSSRRPLLSTPARRPQKVGSLIFLHYRTGASGC